MDEYVISFIDSKGQDRQIAFRGVGEDVAKAFAKGLTIDGFSGVNLAGSVPRRIDIGATGPVGQ